MNISRNIARTTPAPRFALIDGARTRLHGEPARVHILTQLPEEVANCYDFRMLLATVFQNDRARLEVWAKKICRGTSAPYRE